jgi:23S rRNA (pseudouridine1915-N3)-methyltransferase
MITIIAIGKKHEPWVANGIERYQKRLHAPWDIRWVLLPHSALKGDTARQNESQAILSKLGPADYVILLDERGKLLASPALSQTLQQLFVNSKNVVLVIGGAYGVSDELTKRANLVWSLSPLVFPHQLVRLILAEQVYRASEIATGHPYHHA